ncbi:glutamate--tRNA ligase [Limimaricola pyoseonensis]|uniref:Glutamate--tRNA ligase n=1 Tax=Limimaricola pyoseonensis TaxID=521013 RepID=A0A1G7G4Z7_9RHOB|nr:glutamate--tRNA ligase [Limimaricola pyoseonensis]SDE83089.1 glutamyl-tRNA synthetase [Limimaricola pyoseonensis]
MTTTRFAPSPTGWLHIGNLRAALFNHAIARQQGGEFILRIDDTDAERSKPEYVDGILEALDWLGLKHDRVEKQSDRLERYEAAKAKLIADGRLYECFETPTELDLKRKKQLNMGKPPVYDRAALELSEEEKDRLRAERGSHWRFKLDRERIEWEDGILGPISIDAASVSDPVLIKESGQVLYTFASSVDDAEMGITDVVRGSDHVTNTATQIQIIRALGHEPPRFAHHSLLTGPQGEALSKRLGTLSLRDLKAAGIEPMAILSLMARLGSSQPVELRQTPEEVVEGFDIATFGAAPTKFDPADLEPLTARYLSTQPLSAVADDVRAAGVPDDLAEPFWAVVRENLKTRATIAEWWAVFRDGKSGHAAPEDAEFVATALGLLGEPPYGPETWKQWTDAVKAETGRKGKGLFLPLRRAVTGLDSGPEMADVMALMQVRPQV